MMFYKKEVTVPAFKRETAQCTPLPFFSGERSVKNGLRPEICLNFRSVGGELRGGFGTRRVFGGNPLEGYAVISAYIWGGAATNGRLVFLTSDGAYSFPLRQSSGTPVPELLSEQTFSKVPRGVRCTTKSGAPVLLLCSGEGMFTYDGSEFSRIDAAPPSSTGCAYYDRIFSVSSEKPYRIYFSAPLEEENWEAAYRTAGYMDLFPEAGAVHALFPCDKSLYALRERGIARLRAEGENFNFTVAPVAAAYGKVYEDSVQSVGSRLVFLASDGLYIFDGNTVKRTAESNAGLFFGEEPDCRSCVYGAYYVLNYRTAQGERRTLFLDPKTEEKWLSDLDFESPASEGADCCFSDGGVLATFTAQSVRLENPLTKIWESGYTRLNLGAGEKIIREISLFGKGNFKLTVQRGHAREKRTYDLILNGEETVRPSLKDEGFFLRAESGDADCVLEKICVKADVSEEVSAV